MTPIQPALFDALPSFFPVEDFYELHTHHFVSGPRSSAGYRNGKWEEGDFQHSHPGGSIPHTHPHTGPSYFGHGKRKSTERPDGEQFPYIERDEEENSFELILTDSALINGKTPVGDTPIESLGFPAAERMTEAFRMRCIIRDERKAGAR